MENPALSQLHQYLKTKNDAQTIMRIIGSLGDALYKEPFTMKEALAQYAPFEIAAAIERAAPDPEDKSGLQKFFSQLQKDITELPIIHIILPFSPKEKLIKVIHDWFYDNFQKTVLLDVTIDPDLGGGSVISFRGRANDYSLKNQIDQMNAGV